MARHGVVDVVELDVVGVAPDVLVVVGPPDVLVVPVVVGVVPACTTRRQLFLSVARTARSPALDTAAVPGRRGRLLVKQVANLLANLL